MQVYLDYRYTVFMEPLKDNHIDRAISIDQPGIYRICLRGRLSDGACRRFSDMSLTIDIDKSDVVITTLLGEIADQAALHGILARIRDLGVPIIEVTLIRPLNKGE